MFASAPAVLPAGAPLPVETATLYPEDDGFFARRAKARRAKLVGNLEDVLRKAFEPGETLRYVARGVRYYLVEHVFGGAAVAQYHNMTALCVTDRRLLLVQLDRKGKPGDIKNAVSLEDVREARGAGFLGWRIRLADGTKMAFASIRRADKKRLEALLPKRDAGAAPASGPALVHLCPACVKPVPGVVGTALTCPREACRIPFRDPRKAARLSAFVPGLGDLYLRHHLFGSMEFLGSMAMLGAALALLADAAVGRDVGSLGVAGVVAVLLVGIPRLIDYKLTLHMGRKGLVPLALAPAPGAQTRNLPSYPRWSPILFLAGLAVTGGIVALLGEDLRHDAGLRQASELAAAGRLDEAHARWAALQQAGGENETRRVKFATALVEAGDLEGADAIRESFQETKIDAAVVDRWNAVFKAEQAALEDYNEGLAAVAKGDEAAWARVDRALAYFRNVKRPHLPSDRAEVSAHFAALVLAEPLREEDVRNAQRWVEGSGGAPAAELAVVKAAYASAGGDAGAARAALATVKVEELPVSFRLLALEAQARIATTAAERAAVKAGVEAFEPLADSLGENELERLDALAELE